MHKKQTESVRYQKVIVSRKEILDLLTEAKKPLSLKQVIKKLNYQKDEQKCDGLSRRLSAMARDGQLLHNRQGNFGVSSKMDLIVGMVQGHAEGFGFLIPEEGGKDLFLHFKQMRQVMHGDKVLAQVMEFKGKKEAKIVEVLSRANEQLVARFLVEQGVGIGIPVNTRIKHEINIPESAQKGAKNNQMVLLEITQQPDKRFGPIGKVLEVLGGHLDPGMEINVALHAWGIPHTWPDALSEQANKIPTSVSKKDFHNRIDLRDTPLVTIDGEDARDFDDAIWCQKTDKGWKALVAIADVSHYVEIKTALDDEAQKRSTSVYFPEFVVPMLPEALSNGICSLNPAVDRCAMVCEMLINSQGKVTRSKFFTAVIRSHARLTYTEVGDLIENPSVKKNQILSKKLPVLSDLHDLYQAMKEARKARGTIDFDTVETKIQFGKNKKIEALVPVYRNDAHKIVEELMIAANVCAGRFLTRHKMPTLYRVHGGPKLDKIESVREFLRAFGLSLGGGEKPTPSDYAKAMVDAKQKPEFELIQIVLLRSLSQAVYTPKNEGHFGLAHDVYAHFTSPIRRYPDLLVHRAIRHILTNGTVENYQYSAADMEDFGTHCSVAERRADDATRDVVDWLKCEYMQDKIGEVWPGKVSGVTNFGLFVQLDNIYVDGLLHISALDGDYYHFDAIHHKLSGEASGKTYKLGDRLTVKVAKVDLDERKIDFVLPNSEGPDKSAKHSKSDKRKTKKSDNSNTRKSSQFSKSKKSDLKNSRKQAGNKMRKKSRQPK